MGASTVLAGCTAGDKGTPRGEPEPDYDTGGAQRSQPSTANAGGEGSKSGGAGSNADDVTNTIAMTTDGSSYYFDPVGLYVEPGETITWKIVVPPHSSTAYKKGNGPASVTRIPKGAKAWDSGLLSQKGATFQYTFSVKGTYDYFCTPHKSLGMVARIVCGEPGGPAVGSMPPDGTVPTSKEIVENGSIPWSEEYGQ